jgi:Methylase involved in ubiquinone/menaquinone biosynthesis
MNQPLRDADTIRITKHFSSLLASHGMSPQSLDWGSQQTQEARFAALADIADLANTAILDVGCGLADLHAWLLARGVPHRYTGVDVTQAMAAQAAARFPDAEVLHAEALKAAGLEDRQFDYVFASGIFYLRQNDPMAYLQSAVAKMFAMCRRGIAFNSLSSWSSRQDPQEFYADPLLTAAHCRTLSSRLVLRHDYHPGDFTIYLYRERQA